MNEKGFYSSAIPDHRKRELLKRLPYIMTDLPTKENGGVVIGNNSLAQEICNRIESITKRPDEFQYLVDATTYLINKSKGQEVEILYKGKVIPREVLAKEFGIFLKRKKEKNSFNSLGLGDLKKPDKNPDGKQCK